MNSDLHSTSTIPATGEQRAASPPASTHEPLYPRATRELAEQRTRLIAVAVAHVTQCPYRIRSHTGAALRHGATGEEVMEAVWVAAELRAGGAYAHSALALDVIAHEQAEHAGDIKKPAGTRGAGIASSAGKAG